jgi:hypothetical protein
VDDGSGLVTMVPAWMLDPIVCLGMKAGEARISVAALRELHYRLVERGLRRDSSNDSTVVQEECDGSDLRDHSAADSSAGRGTASEQSGVHLVQLSGMNQSQRASTRSNYDVVALRQPDGCSGASWFD